MAKELSGAQKRKRRREREEKQRAAAGVDAATTEATAKLYGVCGPPPLDDPLAMTIWAQKMAATTMWLMVSNPGFDPQLGRLILEGVRTVGMVSIKAIGNKRVADVAKKAGMTRKGRANDGTEPYRRGTPSTP